MNKPLVVSFVLGVVFGCFAWHFGSEIIKHTEDKELSPQEEVERLMDCLGIGD
jgi:hypothetical protein